MKIKKAPIGKKSSGLTNGAVEFPMRLTRDRFDFLDKHKRQCGKGSRSAFIVGMFEGFINNGIFCYRYPSKNHDVTKENIRGVANNLGQAIAQFKTYEDSFVRKIKQHQFDGVIDSIRDVQRKNLELNKDLTRHWYPTATGLSYPKRKPCTIKRRVGRPRVKEKPIKVKLYITSKQKALFVNAHLNSGGEHRQLARFLIELFEQMCAKRKFRYSRPIHINRKLEKAFSDRGSELNVNMRILNRYLLNGVNDIKKWQSMCNSIIAVSESIDALRESLPAALEYRRTHRPVEGKNQGGE